MSAITYHPKHARHYKRPVRTVTAHPVTWGTFARAFVITLAVVLAVLYVV